MNRRAPVRTDRRPLHTVQGSVGPESELENAYLGGDAIIAGTGTCLEACGLHGTTIAHAVGIRVRSCRLETVDAANADMERSSWHDSEVTGSRFTGAKLSHAHIAQVVFEACTLSLAQFQSTKMRRVRFEGCDLRGAYFNGSDLAGTVFAGSNLTGCDFSGAVLARCDFRRATIDEMRVAPEQLQGVIVTSDQALYLTRLFGLNIQE